jgi:cell division protein FtsL
MKGPLRNPGRGAQVQPGPPGPDAAGGGKPGKVWYLLTFALLAAFFVLGSGLVWLNIERVDLAYKIRKMQDQLEEKRALMSKLQVERDNLVSPYRLKPLAREYGLAEARSGQVRRLDGEDK